MSTLQDRIADAELEAYYDSLGECPKCGCRSLVVKVSYPATRIDPACSAGYCDCRNNEECPCTYEWG